MIYSNECYQNNRKQCYDHMACSQHHAEKMFCQNVCTFDVEYFHFLNSVPVFKCLWQMREHSAWKQISIKRSLVKRSKHTGMSIILDIQVYGFYSRRSWAFGFSSANSRERWWCENSTRALARARFSHQLEGKITRLKSVPRGVFCIKAMPGS